MATRVTGPDGRLQRPCSSNRWCYAAEFDAGKKTCRTHLQERRNKRRLSTAAKGRQPTVAERVADNARALGGLNGEVRALTRRVDGIELHQSYLRPASALAGSGFAGMDGSVQA